MKENRSNTEFLTDPGTFWQRMLSGEKEVVSWNLVNDDVMQLTSKAAEGFDEQNGTTNVVIAAFTTCYARLLLLKYMDEVESTRPQRILYFGKSLFFYDSTSVVE